MPRSKYEKGWWLCLVFPDAAPIPIAHIGTLSKAAETERTLNGVAPMRFGVEFIDMDGIGNVGPRISDEGIWLSFWKSNGH